MLLPLSKPFSTPTVRVLTPEVDTDIRGFQPIWHLDVDASLFACTALLLFLLFGAWHAVGAFEKVILASQDCLAAAWMQLGNAWVGGLELGLVASSNDV